MSATRNQQVPENFYRPTNGRTLNWYIRLVPPAPIKGQPGVAEFRKSTGTADLRRAKAIGARLIADKRAEWDQLLAGIKTPGRGPKVLTRDLIEHLCARRHYQWLRMDDTARFEGAGYDDEARAGLKRLCETTDASMRSVLARGRAAAEWADVLEVIDVWCEQAETPVARTDPLYPELVRRFAEVELSTVDSLLRRVRGEAAPTPAKPGSPGVVLSAMTERYRAHKQQSASGKHVGTSVHVWVKLIEHLGDVPLSSVRAADLYGFLEARMHASLKPWSMQHAHGLVKRTLREVFGLASTQGLYDGANPVDAMVVLPKLSAREEKARRHPRHPFTDGQLSALFASEWYQGTSTRWTGKMAQDLPARYWVPLVCMFHGNRVREVLQLVASDCAKAGGISVVHFRQEIEGGQAAMAAAGVQRSLKNDPTARVVPVHPTLLALGFLEFVQQRRKEDGPNAMLFPSSLPRPGGKNPILGRAYEQAFLRYVRDDMKFGRGFGNHSFRHQLEDRIRDAQLPGHRWPAGLAQAYTGRKRVRDADRGYIEAEGSEGGYGRGHGPKAILRYVESLDFRKVKLPPHFDAWHASARAAADL